MTRNKQRIAPLLVFLMLLVVCLVGLPIQSTALAASDYANASTDLDTGYFMEIPLAGNTGEFLSVVVKGQAYSGQNFHWFKRSERQATIVITFPQVNYEKPGFAPEPVFVNGTALMEFPGSATLGFRIDFLKFQQLNIRKEFFHIFLKSMGADWKTDTEASAKLQFKVMIMLGNNGYNMFETIKGKTYDKTYTADIHIYTGKLDPGHDDPDSPNFDPGTNGGSVTTDPGKSISWLKSFYNLLTKWFKWNLPYEWFCVIFWTLVGLIALAILLSIKRAIFGK